MPSYFIDPNGDTKMQWTTFPTPGQTGWSNTNKAVRQPGIPSTSSGVKDHTGGDLVELAMTTVTIPAGEAVQYASAWFYMDTGSDGLGVQVTFRDSLNNGNNARIIAAGTATGWQSVQYMVTPFTQGVIDGLEAWASTVSGGTGTIDNNVYEAYIELITDPPYRPHGMGAVLL